MCIGRLPIKPVILQMDRSVASRRAGRVAKRARIWHNAAFTAENTAKRRGLTMMRRFVWIMLMAGVLGGCDKVKVSDDSVAGLSESQVASLIGQEQVVIIDVRKADAYAAGHLPGAINIFLPNLRAKDERLASAKQIVVYAGGWTDPLGTAGAKSMMAKGYSNVYEFRGGLEVWKSAGHEVVTSVKPTQTRPETEGK
ncbi:MAG: hypothetical protein GC162_05700 [Planctomycetes bacterium]|nr:hypothetical protein [Planctomycetota bacterium]